MITRLTWASILSIVLIPLLAIGWLDPLEGLPAVVLGTGLGVAVRLLSKVRIPKFTWISYVVAAGLMILLLVIVIVQGQMMMATQQTGNTVMNPISGEFAIGGMPVAILLLWAARIADVVMVAGLIYYSVLVCKALAAARRARAVSHSG